MMNYKLTCADGFTKTLTAPSKDDAVTLFMADPDVQAHVSAGHPEMAGKSPEEMTAAVAAMVTEEVAAPTGSPTDGGVPPAGGAPMGGAGGAGTV